MKKFIIRLLGVIGVLISLNAVFLRQSYTRQMPETPQIDQGRTNLLDANYGKTIYVTNNEKLKLEISYGAVLVVAVLFVGFAFWSAKQNNKT